MNTIETIKAEVERMNKIAQADVLKNEGEKRVWNQGIVTAYSYVLSFLSTLQEKSEKPINPVCEELEEEVKAWHKKHFKAKNAWEDYSGHYLDKNSQLDFARHFYELGRQSKPKVSEELEKYASQEGFNYVSLVVRDAEPNHRWNDHDVEFAYRDGIINGASWQKGHNEIAVSEDELYKEIERWINSPEEWDNNIQDIEATARHFAKWQKEQMMKEAVETWMLEGSMYEPEFIKKKVIVIKEDNQ